MPDSTAGLCLARELERTEAMERQRRLRIVLQVGFAVGGLSWGIGGFTDVLTLLVFGILGPIAIRYDML